LVGGSMTAGGLMVTTERLNRIREVRPDTRIAIVEAGVILQNLHEAADAQGLYFPLWFGARGSAMIAGVLSTNAGGSNVLRYDPTTPVAPGASAPRGADPRADGTVPVTAPLEEALAQRIAEAAALDAEIAQTEAQRLAMWKRRELAAEITLARQPAIDTDIAL